MARLYRLKSNDYSLEYWRGALKGAFEECEQIEQTLGLPPEVHTRIYTRLKQWESLLNQLEEVRAEFDRDTVLAMLDEIERLRREVREWMCDRCNTVYPDPPQPGIWCAQCPRCGGDTAPRGVIERRRLEQEIERLRREREEAGERE